MSLPQGEMDLRLVGDGDGGGYIALTVLSTSNVMCLPHVCDESMAIRQSRKSSLRMGEMHRNLEFRVGLSN